MTGTILNHTKSDNSGIIRILVWEILWDFHIFSSLNHTKLGLDMWIPMTGASPSAPPGRESGHSSPAASPAARPAPQWPGLSPSRSAEKTNGWDGNKLSILVLYLYGILYDGYSIVYEWWQTMYFLLFLLGYFTICSNLFDGFGQCFTTEVYWGVHHWETRPCPPVLAVEVQGLAKVELRIEVVQWNCESQTDPVALRRHNGDSSQFTSKKRDLTSLNWIPRNRDLANSNLEFADQHK